MSILYWVVCGLSAVSCFLWTKWLVKDSTKGRKFTVYAAYYDVFLAICQPILVLIFLEVGLNSLKTTFADGQFDISSLDSNLVFE